MDLNVLLDFLKVSVGLVYLYLEYNARKSLWIASVIMPIIGMWLFYNKGLYADFAINIYYLVIAIYGYVTWSRHSASEKSELPITHIGPRMALALAAVWILMWCAVAWVLATFTDSTVVWLDSFTTSLSVVGMWMLARKYIEQWWVWFVVDGVYVYLYYYKGIYFSGTLYAFYTVMAVMGYYRWKRLSE
ncbi:MAG: nicotinamide riboside transporter PnuC [Muribaculaceae bacterium]|nr:nicotinamide riboside transporter PnuC [Muribaculaceae bacterium]